jgi:hypothetical protein
MVAVALTRFVAPAVLLPVQRVRGSSWLRSLETAAVVVYLLNGLAFFVAMFGVGGV